MKGRYLSSDGDMVEQFFFDDMEKKSHIKVVQDVAPYLRQNNLDRTEGRQGWKGEVHKIASIPLVVLEQWRKEIGSDPLDKNNRPWLIARLNNKDWAKLRTKEGRI